jgi:hypothetical protein
MPELKDLFNQARDVAAGKALPLYLTEPHSQWLELPETERQYSPEAVQFVADVLLGKYAYPRVGRFSPSSIGGCARRLVFGFIGAPEEGSNMDSEDLMAHGKWGHLRWQAEGLTLGWMRAGEVWTSDLKRRMGGSIDGMLEDDSLLELKTAIMSKYTRVTIDGPELEHLWQFQAYAEMEGVSVASVVYEDRGTGQFHEFRIEPDEKIGKQLYRKLEMLNNHVEDGTLPDMLPDCETRTGKIYRNCPYRKYCPTATDASLRV